jgi:hypothetical protein
MKQHFRVSKERLQDLRSCPQPPTMGAFKALVFPKFQGVIVLYPLILGIWGESLSNCT